MKQKRPITPEAAMQQMAAYCSIAELCESEVRSKLEKMGIQPTDADKIVDRLIDDHFLDESRYCRAYISDKYRFAKWGRRKIQQGLCLKQVPSRVYMALMDEVIDQDEYMDNLRHLLAQKSRLLHESDSFKLRNALMRFAIQRGFLPAEIMEVIGDIGDMTDDV